MNELVNRESLDNIHLYRTVYFPDRDQYSVCCGVEIDVVFSLLFFCVMF